MYQDHGHGGAGVATSVVMRAPRHDTGGYACLSAVGGHVQIHYRRPGHVTETRVIMEEDLPMDSATVTRDGRERVVRVVSRNLIKTFINILVLPSPPSH